LTLPASQFILGDRKGSALMHPAVTERPTFDESVRALESEADSIIALLADLPDDQWGRSTRLPGWDMFILVAHLTRTIKTLSDYAGLGPDSPPLPAVATDPTEAGREVDARAREFAERHTPTTLRATLSSVVTEAAAIARRLGPDAEIPRRGGKTRLDRYIRSRVVEACVHGLDIRAAIGASVEPTPLAQRVTTSYFEELLTRRGDIRPDDLSDDVAFIEAATGRRTSENPDFPLLR
jgi:uncharacterized protein (TIGR03083 family)